MRGTILKKIVLLLGIFIVNIVLSQNVGINASGFAPNLSSMLDIDVAALTPKKGLLIPRITLAERTAMSPLPAAAQGLIIYQTNGVEGFYYNNSITTTPNWVYLLPSSTAGAGWTTTGNLGTTPSAAAYSSAVTNNFLGTTDNVDFVFASNNLERMRISATGLFGIGTNALINHKLEVTSANSSLNTIYASHGSTAAAPVYSAIKGELTGAGIATAGNLSYHNSNDKRFAVYGIGGDLAGAFNGYVSINPVSTNLTTNDLEIRNTVGGDPVNVLLRQTAAQTASGTVLGNLSFGDNHQTTGQAQITAIRAAAGGAGDNPTDMLFYTTPDGSVTLTERMRILNTGQIGIGTVSVFASDFINVNPSGMTGTIQNGEYITMPNSGTNASIGLRVQNNSASQTGNKTGFYSGVGGNDGASNLKRAYWGLATGNFGTLFGGRFEALASATTALVSYGVYGFANSLAANSYALYGAITLPVTPVTTNIYALGLENGHIKSIQTTAPTISAVTTYVPGSQTLANATDIAGKLTIVTTAAAGSVTITFNIIYAVAPIVIITPTNANAATDVNRFFVTTTTTGFTINFSVSPAANSKTYNYFVIETQ